MAAKVSTNLSLDPTLKQQSIELFSDLGMDLSTAVSVFLKKAVSVQEFPFPVTRETPNQETIDALNEYYEMKYRNYNSFKDLMKEVLADA